MDPGPFSEYVSRSPRRNTDNVSLTMLVSGDIMNFNMCVFGPHVNLTPIVSDSVPGPDPNGVKYSDSDP